MGWLTEYSVAGNELWRVVGLFMTILAGLVIGKMAGHYIARAAGRAEKRNRSMVAVALRSLSRSAVFLLFVFALAQGMRFLVLAETIMDFASTLISISAACAVGYLLYCFVDVVDIWLRRITGRGSSGMDEMLVPMVRKSLRVTIVILLLVQIAQYLSDKPITSIIAGLGVGGLAIALAAQDTIKNFFGSLLLLADKPFELGDRVVVDGHDGPVEEVGFRTTRIRTLEGHLVSIPNGELANRTLQNVGKRPYIRRFGQIGITYDTPPEKVQRALKIVKEVLADHEGMNPEMPPRVYFSGFGAFSLDIIFFYWFHPPDYWSFMTFSEWVNMEILRRFNAEGIDFAFPTQTLHLAGDKKRPMYEFEPRSGEK